MDEKILTVTVPSYNVQAYLEDCLESFVNSEVMDDIEVLIVNDGSSDDTATIAERYVSKYENTFRLINKAPLRMRTYNELRTDTKKHLDEGNENGYNIVTSL